jgi:hypothetical protein
MVIANAMVLGSVKEVIKVTRIVIELIGLMLHCTLKEGIRT